MALAVCGGGGGAGGGGVSRRLVVRRQRAKGGKSAGGPTGNPSATSKRLADGAASVDVSPGVSPPLAAASPSPSADFLWKAVLRKGLREGIVTLAATAPDPEDSRATATGPAPLNPPLPATPSILGNAPDRISGRTKRCQSIRIRARRRTPQSWIKPPIRPSDEKKKLVQYLPGAAVLAFAADLSPRTGCRRPSFPHSSASLWSWASVCAGEWCEAGGEIVKGRKITSQRSTKANVRSKFHACF